MTDVEPVVPNTNPYALDFVNREIVPAAGALHRLYIQAKDTLASWYGRDVASVIANDSVPIGDGGVISGSPLTGIKATNIIVRLSEFVADYEAGGNAKLNTVVAVSRD